MQAFVILRVVIIMKCCRKNNIQVRIIKSNFAVRLLRTRRLFTFPLQTVYQDIYLHVYLLSTLINANKNNNCRSDRVWKPSSIKRRKSALDILKYGAGSKRKTDVLEHVRGYDNIRTAVDCIPNRRSLFFRQPKRHCIFFRGKFRNSVCSSRLIDFFISVDVIQLLSFQSLFAMDTLEQKSLKNEGTSSLFAANADFTYPDTWQKFFKSSTNQHYGYVESIGVAMVLLKKYELESTKKTFLL